MNLKSIGNFVCPKFGNGFQLPYGFSRMPWAGVTLRIPLPFRYKAWSRFRCREVWGTVNLVVNSRVGFKLWWCADV